jgi:hypothetical protein
MVEIETASDFLLRPAGAGAVTTTCLDGHGTWVIAFTGEHDRWTTGFLDHQVDNVWRRCHLVVVDLTAATFIDSSVIEWLLRTRDALRSTGHNGLRVVLGPPGSPASRLLALASPSLRGALACHATIEGALGVHDSARAGAGPRRNGQPGAVPTVFDRVEARAWVLAVWIVRDVQLADELVVAAFSARSDSGAPLDDDQIVADVRQRAIAAEPTPRGAAGIAAEAVREAILGLPGGQRELVELLLFGGLSIDGLEAVTRMPRAVVIDHLVHAMRVLRPVLGRRARDGAALASALPVPSVRLVPPERWASRSRAARKRGVVVHGVGAER